ncbi:LPP20 family lipoprotein [Nautilia sp.]
MKSWYFLLIFLFVSCTSPEPPKWYIKTPKDTRAYFYASAEGYSKKEALKTALNDIASRINVKISSNFVINRGIHNKKTYNEIYQQINTRISDINFNNYEILKTQKTDDKYYVLIRVNKHKLIKSLKTKLELKLQNLSFNGESPIKNVISAYRVLNRLKSVKSEMFILESLGIDINGYISTIQNLQKKAETIITNTKFSLKANMFKDATIEVLSKYLTITPSSENIISVKVALKKLTLFNSYIVNGKARILIDKPYTVVFLGKSVSGYKEALVFAKEEYKRRLKNLTEKIFSSF